ncbi:ATP-dependent helicase [Candidatus Phytoplasma meliae]|uniref:DNA 3'-5' helicase n=1 Tax=Candidatus Phytoplasma meliae TaxID=1848402 RepID=A0ABS5CY69_9MOLU|nr:UvrD-helicase domain-containing protein [Candidatus Phytoplasma meliae]MBP5835919.1 UvrD-helicase domain-containing protein [Candidatus Phytoplasma meliae]
MFSQIDNWLKKLNQKQMQAVTSKEPSFYLVAGAGTGKTTTLIMKIAYLIKKENVPGKNILALTFTNKAANQMQNKILQIINCPNQEINICTFHALGHQVLRKFIHLLPFGYQKNFIIIDHHDSNKILKIILKELKLDLKLYDISQLRRRISLIKRKVQPKDAESFFKKPFQTESANPLDLTFKPNLDEKIKDKYQKHLQSHNLIDFDDLILHTYNLLKDYPQVKQFYQLQFQYLLVDEFQDTDFFQYQILTFLAEKHRCIFVVGDPDQNIYSFRGACFENSQLFLKHFDPQISFLEQNYRSLPNILTKANLLISFNQEHPFKKILTSTQHEQKEEIQVVAQFFENYYLEMQYIVDKIQALVKNKKYCYQDFAILYRNNAIGKTLEKAFLAANIPYIVFGNLSFYQSKIIKDFLAYLQMIINPFQDFYFKRIINVPKRQIGKVALQHLETFAKTQNLSFFETLQHLEQIKITQGAKKQLKQFQELIKESNIKLIKNQFHSLSDIITYVDQIICYSSNLNQTQAKDQDIDGKLKADNSSVFYIEELKNVLEQFEQNAKGNHFEKLTNFLEQISLYNETNEEITQNKQINNYVKLATIHKVKGLEFKVVFLAGLENNIFDFHKLEELEESRRLVYVAITRAREKLFLTGAYQRNLYGKNLDHLPSIFLKEMGFCFTKNNSNVRYPFQKGDQVKHYLFGLGVVTSLQEKIIIVQFLKPWNIKKFENSNKYLQKISF